MEKLTRWTPAAVEELKRLHAAGKTGGQMAKALGFTRSSILGKMHRLGLSQSMVQHRVDQRIHGLISAGVIKKRTAKPQKPPPEPKIVSTVSISPAVPKSRHAAPGGLPLDRLRRHACRFAVTRHEETVHLFCGRPALEGDSYCAEHAAICRTGQGPKIKMDRRWNANVRRVRT